MSGLTWSRNNRKIRLWLAIGFGLIVLFCIGGVGVFVSFYDESTKINRSAPDAVVDNFLRAYLVNRDDQEASLYECKAGADFAEIGRYRDEISSRESRFSVGIRVTWSTFTVETHENNGLVTTDLIKTTTDRSGRVGDSWSFSLKDQDGWRVCGATKLP